MECRRKNCCALYTSGRVPTLPNRPHMILVYNYFGFDSCDLRGFEGASGQWLHPTLQRMSERVARGLSASTTYLTGIYPIFLSQLTFH